MTEPKIYSAMCNVMAEIGAIPKDSVNGTQHYNFRSIDAVYNALQPILCKHRVFVIPEVLERKREERLTGTGKNMIYSILRIRYTFYADDGSSISAVVEGEGMDTGDKASNKAMSVAFKYACFQAFCVPTEELKDPDEETPPESTPVITCGHCGKVINGVRANGKEVSALEVSEKCNGLCYHCYREAVNGTSV